MAIRFDRTRISIVVVCDCGWRDLGITREAAYSLAEDHERRVHPDDKGLRQAAARRRKNLDDGGPEMSTGRGTI